MIIILDIHSIRIKHLLPSNGMMLLAHKSNLVQDVRPELETIVLGVMILLLLESQSVMQLLWRVALMILLIRVIMDVVQFVDL